MILYKPINCLSPHFLGTLSVWTLSGPYKAFKGMNKDLYVFFYDLFEILIFIFFEFFGCDFGPRAV